MIGWTTMGGRGPVIGLDLNGSRAMAAEMTGRPGRARPGRTASIRRPDPSVDPDPAEWRRLADVLARRGFRGRGLAVAVPAPALLLETIELPPPASGAPLDELARGELAAMHRLAPEQLTAAALPLPARRDGGGGRSLAVGCRIQDVAALLEGAEAAGLRIDHLTAAGLAVANGDGAFGGSTAAPSSAAAAGPSVRLLVVAGWRWVELVVLREGRLASMRVLPDLGVQWIDAELRRSGAEPAECEQLMGAGDADAIDSDLRGRRDELTTSYVERLAMEASRSLAYVEQEHGPPAAVEVRVLGEGSACPGLLDALGEDLGVAVAATPASASAVARGLAVDTIDVGRRKAA